MIHFNNAEHGKAIVEVNTGDPVAPYTPGWNHCVSRTKNDKLVGGVIYENYFVRSIAIHVCSFEPNWLNRDFLWACFHYPFVQLGVEKVFAYVDSTKASVVKFDLGIGFTEENRIKDAVIGGDILVLSMYAKDCKWLDWTPKTITAPNPLRERVLV